MIRIARLILSFASLAACADSALAQAAFPSKPLLFISPFAPGPGPDIYLRPLVAKLAENLGQTVVLDNKVGFGGSLAAQQVVRSAPDGYTLTMVTNSNIIQRFLQRDVGYDPLTDFSHVTQLTLGASLLVVAVDSPLKSVEDLVAQAKASPGKLNYGSGGAGTPSHMAMATLAAVSGLDMVHVPFKNSADVIPAMMRGDLHASFQVQTFAMPFVRSGKMRVMAVTAGRRLPAFADVPTMTEATRSDLMVQETWAGVSIAAKTPAPIVRRLHSEIVKAIADPTVQKGMNAGGSNPNPSETPEAYQAFFSKEYGKWREIVKLSGVKAD
ncbi:MAG: tripartite tricarboxylate transporter substrate binding protein [Betaproteobacteria bacterium]|nr:tripartite tricarboxylate transporter substrate binding protein [Betaproteobacteria bacterium]